MDHYKSTLMLLYPVLSKSLKFDCVRILRYTITYLHIYFGGCFYFILANRCPFDFQIKPEQALAALEASMESEELEIFKSKAVRMIEQPVKNYK